MPITVVLASLTIWSNHFESTFQDDDFHVIVKNRAIQDPANIPQFFTTPLLYADQPEYVQYRPLALTSLALDYWLASPVNAGVFDIDSFAWFILALLLYGGLCAVIPGSNWRSALLAAGLFAFHPVTGETLNYASRRGDIMGAVGLLGGLVIRIIWPRHLPAEIMHWHGGVPKTDWDDFRRRWSPQVNRAYRRFVEAPLGLYLLPVMVGMLADPAVAVFPLLLLAYILLFEGGESKAAWRRVLPSAIVCALYWAAQLVFTWKYAAGFRQPSLAWWITQPWVTLCYLWEFLAPVHLSAVSDLRVLPHFWSPLALLGFVGVAALAAGAWELGKRGPWRAVSFGIWWFLIALLPVMMVPQRAVETDTRLFLALPGLVLAATRAASLAYLSLRHRGTARASSARRTTDIAATSLAGLVLALLCVLTYERNEIWKSQVSFWEDVTAKNPRDGRAFVEYGAAHDADGQTDRGYDELLHGASLIEAAARIAKDAPDEVRLARAFDLRNKDAEAEAHFKLAIDADPNYASAWSAYSQWLILRQRAPEAYKAALRAVQLSPWNTEAQHTLLQYYSDLSDWPSLGKTAANVLRIDPTDADGKRSAAVARTAAEALTAAEEKSKQEPTVDGFLSLSVRYYRARRFEDSIGACKDALKLRPETAEAYSNMAAAYYALGKTDDAIKALREAIRVQPDLVVARKNLDFLMSLKAEGRQGVAPDIH